MIKLLCFGKTDSGSFFRYKAILTADTPPISGFFSTKPSRILFSYISIKDAVDALALLTHDDSVPYMDYVALVKDNPVAKAVKIEDLKHNSDLTRSDITDQKALQRVETSKKANLSFPATPNFCLN